MLFRSYFFGWAFGDRMAVAPTVCLPDDHDVYQGNIWGEGGKIVKAGSMNAISGYRQPVEMVEVVHQTNCGQLPEPFDPTPAKNGITVYYTHLRYGRTSFAILGDRQFKSGPERVDTSGGDPKSRADHVQSADVDIASLDKPGLTLLGQRQLDFLNAWVDDWKGVDLKVVLSETVFANAATHHGAKNNYLYADLDSGGWPQSARAKALLNIRRAFPLHVNGDQHLTMLSEYGIEQPHDGPWSFCTPAVSVGYQRWWRPEEMGQQPAPMSRPPHGLPNTGDFRDGFGNLIHVYAVGNPEGSAHPNRYTQAAVKASGLGFVELDPAARSYTCHAIRFAADPANPAAPANPFPGFPHTIPQAENGGLPFTPLPEVTTAPGPAGTGQVVRVFKTTGGARELVSARRLPPGNHTLHAWQANANPADYEVTVTDD